MRVLIFQAATSAAAIAAMTRLSDTVRNAGHSGGLRNLAAFRREKEPADRILVALKPSEAARLKTQGAELVATFQDADRVVPIELPEEDEKLADFDFESVVGDLDSDEDKEMTMDQLRAEAIERGLEVRVDSTRAELEHALDIDHHPGPQEGDRLTDRANMEQMPVDRIGLRTSSVLPTTNGLDLDRMNDEQLATVAAQLGLKVPRGAKRQTVINKITQTFAEKVGAPEDSAPESQATEPSEDEPATEGKVGDTNADLEGKSAAQLTKIAEAEGIDIGRATAEDTLREKIIEGRNAAKG